MVFDVPDIEMFHPLDKIYETPPEEWELQDVVSWSKSEFVFSNLVLDLIITEQIDGKTFLELNEQDIRDFRYRLGYNITTADMKKILRNVSFLKRRNDMLLARGTSNVDPEDCFSFQKDTASSEAPACKNSTCKGDNNGTLKNDKVKITANATKYIKTGLKPPSIGSKCIPPDVFKTALSLCYSFLVTWITSFVMVIVHERVPDMKRYPPLPDIFLDNVPHIPWAFHMCEITGTLLFLIWSSVCIFHKHRLVLLRRFFALAGTVFLLRCVTMLITSLSVPGTHLQCNQKDYAVDDTSMSFLDSLEVRVSRAYSIWSGLGMSIQGVRTCGDYMFSGHTVALTLLNFFITEYTPRNLYFLHTLTWLLNMFGIFFILAAHEHYSIDVFVAFYITSRLFLYYHTLANNQALMSRDSNRTRIWFPMFSYFESSVEGIIPNEYDSLGSLLDVFVKFGLYVKGIVISSMQRIWLESHRMATASNQKDPSSSRRSITKTTNTQECGICSNDDLPKYALLQSKGASSEHKTKDSHESIDCKKSQ